MAAEEYVATEVLKTQQEILASLKELVATRQRNVFVQERLLAGCWLSKNTKCLAALATSITVRLKPTAHCGFGRYFRLS